MREHNYGISASLKTGVREKIKVYYWTERTYTEIGGMEAKKRGFNKN